jgi:hypothetical protein
VIFEKKKWYRTDPPTNLQKSGFSLRLADKQDVIQETQASTLKPTDLQESEFKLRTLIGKQAQ